MAEVAGGLDSGTLRSLEHERTSLIARLPDKLEELPISDRQEIVAGIREIQKLDGSVHGSIAPWMEHIATLLAHCAQPPRNSRQA